MSEELPAILAEPAAPTTEPVSGLGGVMRTRREKLGIELDEVARKLCLSPRQLVALEADDILTLPSPAFTRGFIRNYARLLNLDADPLLAVYRDMLPQSGDANSISLHSEGIPILTGNRKTWMPYLLASILIGVVGGAWLAYMEWSDRRPVPEMIAPAAKPAPQVTVPAPVPAMEPVVEPAPLSVVELPAAPIEPSVNSQIVLSAPAVKAKNQLAMRFTQQSWVRIADRDGVEIFSKTKPPGSEEVVEGQPPFKVEIGNAAGVQLSYGGQSVDLVPHTKANVARFVLE